KSDPRGPTSCRRTSGWRLALPVLRSATRKVSSLCSRVRPRSVLPKTDTLTGRPVTHTPARKSHELFLPMIHSATWECDESRPPPEERQRTLVVSLSQRVPCSHDPAQGTRGGCRPPRRGFV